MTLLINPRKELNLQLEVPTSSANDYEALFFINGVLKAGEYEVKCPVGIKITRKTLSSRPKLQALLEMGDVELLSKFTFKTRVISGSSYRGIELASQIEEVADPILKAIMGKAAPISEPEYFQMIKVLTVIETKSGNMIPCFPPSFDVKQATLSQEAMAQLAIHHHHLVGKEVEFIPTSISSSTAQSVETEEEDY